MSFFQVQLSHQVEAAGYSKVDGNYNPFVKPDPIHICKIHEHDSPIVKFIHDEILTFGNITKVRISSQLSISLLMRINSHRHARCSKVITTSTTSWLTNQKSRCPCRKASTDWTWTFLSLMEDNWDTSAPANFTSNPWNNLRNLRSISDLKWSRFQV